MTPARTWNPFGRSRVNIRLYRPGGRDRDGRGPFTLEKIRLLLYIAKYFRQSEFQEGLCRQIRKESKGREEAAGG